MRDAIDLNDLDRFVEGVPHAYRDWPRSTICGQKIRAGDRVTLWMASANRDEAAFAHADRLDAGRAPDHHVALGAGGPHYCLGAHLARLEGVAVLDELRPLLPRIEVTGAPDRLRSNFFNGIKHLPAEVV